MVIECAIAVVKGCVALLIAILVSTKIIMKFFVIGHCTTKNRADGKVVIVTGASSGIGKAATKELALRGAKVIMACRNLDKARAAADEIRKSVPTANLAVKRLNLSDLNSVRRFAEEILKEEKKLDILVNNAGCYYGNPQKTIDGYEEMFQTNYLSQVLLTDLLLPLLKKTAPSRIVCTGSVAYKFSNKEGIPILEEGKKDYWNGFSRYGNSKLAILMWARALAEELKSTNVTINVLHPGFVSTDIGATYGTMGEISKRIIFLYARSAVDGAQTILHLCLDDEGKSKTGLFWDECKPVNTSSGNDKKLNEQLLVATRKMF